MNKIAIILFLPTRPLALKFNYFFGINTNKNIKNLKIHLGNIYNTT